ncbi:hypothetical protein [Amycolatopsis regifaucium]|nr:hypothetical protein [Amycolatopsis regifaucium]SFI64163.1 hypothetical protein SAMN04489731_11235 [Amycolatopsis regifaucium]
MVDHRYIGRGHKQKQYLSDAEVLRLHQRRRSVEVDLLGLLDKEVARDPVPNDQSHLFLLAEPLPGREGMLMDLVGKEGWQERLVKLQHEAVQKTQFTPRFSPDLTEASRQHRRPSGAALSSYRLRGDRQLSSESSSESVIDLEFSEDGGMRLYCSRLSDTLKDQRVLFDAGALTLTCQFIALLAAVTAEAGYLGMWGLGLRANNLAGLRSYEDLKGMWGDGPAYSEDNYDRTAMANYADLSESPGRVADALLGRFLRALGTNETHQKTLEKFGK